MRSLSILLSLAALVLASAAECSAAPPAADAPGLAVIAPKAFHPSLVRYVAHKKKQLPVELVALEAVRKDESGDDDAEKLKRFLYRRWKEKQIGYVLLVGDIDVMPVRYRCIIAGDGKKEPNYVFNLTDHYYADVADKAGNFDDWNKLRTGEYRWFYCESHLLGAQRNVNADEIDFLPELAVGRWPVSTPGAVRLVADKTVRYETALQAGKKPGQRQAAVLLWDDLAPRPGVSRWVGALNGWNATTFDSATPDKNPSTALVAAQLNRGLGLLIDIGHGETNGWPAFKKPDLARLNNADRLPIVFSVGCDTTPLGPGTLPKEGYRDRHGKFVSGPLAKATPPPPPGVYQRELRQRTPASFGQQMVVGAPTGAVAYIGFTINSNHWHELMEGFLMAAGQSPAPRLGDAWKFALIHHRKVREDFIRRNIGNFDGLHSLDQGLRAILLGDPTLLLPPG